MRLHYHEAGDPSAQTVCCCTVAVPASSWSNFSRTSPCWPGTSMCWPSISPGTGIPTSTPNTSSTTGTVPTRCSVVRPPRHRTCAALVAIRSAAARRCGSPWTIRGRAGRLVPDGPGRAERQPLRTRTPPRGEAAEQVHRGATGRTSRSSCGSWSSTRSSSRPELVDERFTIASQPGVAGRRQSDGPIVRRCRLRARDDGATSTNCVSGCC